MITKNSRVSRLLHFLRYGPTKRAPRAPLKIEFAYKIALGVSFSKDKYSIQKKVNFANKIPRNLKQFHFRTSDLVFTDSIKTSKKSCFLNLIY